MKVLPIYTPPESVWEEIAKELNPLREAATHTPPESVWEGIEEGLESRQVIPIGRSFWQKTRFYAAASMALLLICWGSYVFLNKSSETIAYSQEKQPEQVAAYPLIDAQYDRIQQLCEQCVAICENPDFKNLKHELDDLTAASQQLKEVIGDYNTDDALHTQLAEIEKERGEILRRLTQQI